VSPTVCYLDVMCMPSPDPPQVNSVETHSTFPLRLFTWTAHGHGPVLDVRLFWLSRVVIEKCFNICLLCVTEILLFVPKSCQSSKAAELLMADGGRCAKNANLDCWRCRLAKFIAINLPQPVL
jgi:hypothetical protein